MCIMGPTTFAKAAGGEAALHKFNAALLGIKQADTSVTTALKQRVAAEDATSMAKSPLQVSSEPAVPAPVDVSEARKRLQRTLLVG